MACQKSTVITPHSFFPRNGFLALELFAGFSGQKRTDFIKTAMRRSVMCKCVATQKSDNTVTFLQVGVQVESIFQRAKYKPAFYQRLLRLYIQAVSNISPGDKKQIAHTYAPHACSRAAHACKLAAQKLITLNQEAALFYNSWLFTHTETLSLAGTEFPLSSTFTVIVIQTALTSLRAVFLTRFTTNTQLGCQDCDIQHLRWLVLRCAVIFSLLGLSND